MEPKYGSTIPAHPHPLTERNRNMTDLTLWQNAEESLLKQLAAESVPHRAMELSQSLLNLRSAKATVHL